MQGTINGLGERTGNADLCQVIPNLQLKLQRRCLPGENLKLLTETSRFIYDVANMPLAVSQPFVGRAAFAHKGGLHVDAVRKNPATYEHIGPEEVGNERRLLLSELSGSATMLEKMAMHKLTHDPKIMRQALKQLQSLENVGYQFEAAEASFALLVRRMLGKEKRFFDFEGFRVIVEKRELLARGGHGGDRSRSASARSRNSAPARATAPSTRSTARCARRSSGSIRRCARCS